MNDLFIGITDFTTRAETEKMLAVLRREGGNQPVRKLGVGVMVSHSTLHGLPSRFTDVFPQKEKIADIFFDDPLAVNVLHYADYKGIDVARSLASAAKWGGQNMQAMQLDMTWPSTKAIRSFRENRPDIKLILQIGKAAFEQIEESSEELVARLKSYSGDVDYVLLDKSMGQGRPMSAGLLLPFASAVSQKLPDMGIVAAGGLGPDTLNLVEPLLKVCPNLCIDAQGRLRPDIPDDPEHCIAEPIHWNLAEPYLVRALAMFSSNMD